MFCYDIFILMLCDRSRTFQRIINHINVLHNTFSLSHQWNFPQTQVLIQVNMSSDTKNSRGGVGDFFVESPSKISES